MNYRLGNLNFTYLKIWDCDDYVMKVMSNKLDYKSDESIFVEYLKEIKENYFFHVEEHNVFITCDGILWKRYFILKIKY